MEMNNTEKAELCEGIVEALEIHGHCTGHYQNSEGQLCLLGAGRMVQGRQYLDGDWVAEEADRRTAFAADRRTAFALGFKKTGNVIEFNDGTTYYGPSLRSTPAIDKETAIEYAMKQAKYWRNVA